MVEVDPDAKGEGTRSIAKNVLRAFGSHMSFQGKTLIDLAASTNAKIGNAVTAAISPLWTVGGQTAMCVSLHYDYGAINGNLASSSAHSVGFMHSPGGLGNRQAGFRFFDPNVGSWRFNKVTELTTFFTNDWIRNFIDNTMTADPPRPGQSTTWKGPRSITGFRLIQFVLV